MFNRNKFMVWCISCQEKKVSLWHPRAVPCTPESGPSCFTHSSGRVQMDKSFYFVVLGGVIAGVFNKTIAGLINTVLSTLGLTYV